MKSDSELQQEVIAALAANPKVLGTSVGVAVSIGVVELSGEVPSQADKLAVERLVQTVAGVKAIAVEIAVVPPGHSTVGDLELARNVDKSLTALASAKSNSLKIAVESGVVTLTGNVAISRDKQAAVDCLRYLRGVVEVVDAIEVKPTLT